MLTLLPVFFLDGPTIRRHRHHHHHQLEGLRRRCRRGRILVLVPLGRTSRTVLPGPFLGTVIPLMEGKHSIDLTVLMSNLCNALGLTPLMGKWYLVAVRVYIRLRNQSGILFR